MQQQARSAAPARCGRGAWAGGEKSNRGAAQAGDPGSLLAHTRRLIGARKAALRTETVMLLTAAGGRSPVLAFLREAPGERMLAPHNLSAAGQRAAAPHGVPQE